MGDLYELQLALDLPASLPGPDLALLRRHLDASEDAGDDTEGCAGEGIPGTDTYPLLASRGPASRIGGVLVGELRPAPHGWALTARQEVHPDEFWDLEGLLKWLAARTTTVGVIGYLRFYEAGFPDVLVVNSKTVSRWSPRSVDRAEAELLPGL
ncbi:hypothetical protein [Streptomyces sp. MST-110588]|uniref:hypothetical protein n=1 Tax=Streptomyces sp. MST-110588 TaxID=2833628 RepID=UPI001F5DE9F1|nr:hypothetical protein [Streptomyces sp. MST-110588]UNO38485.1 hypothetical protein KGS77_01015 [Streptomyces sp. MST-110588]